MMRLFVHGIGVMGMGFDEPFADGPGRLEKLPIEQFAPLNLRRRFGRLSKLVYAAASRAIADAGVADPSELAIICSTAAGEVSVSLELIEQIHSSGGKTISPKLVPNSVHNSPAGHLSIGLGNRQPSVTLSQGWLSAEAGLAAAADLLSSTQCDRALVVAGDEADPYWIERLEKAGAADWANSLTGEAFQECAAAVVLGSEPGGRRLGSLAAGVERISPDGQGLAEMLKRNAVMPGNEAEIRVRAGAGGAGLRQIAAQALGRGRDGILLDGPGPGTSQAGALAAVALFLNKGVSSELLLIGREIDEIGFLHYKVA